MRNILIFFVWLLQVEATKQKLSEIVIESDQLQNQKKRNAEVLSGFDGVPEKLRKQVVFNIQISVLFNINRWLST